MVNFRFCYTFNTHTVASIANSRRVTNKICYRTFKMMRDSVKISTYNVLSSSLCEPGFHRSCSVAALDQSNRLIKVKEKLEQEIASKSIICLQEVSHNWAGKLHPFFVNRGYHLVTALYGHRWNGYMGVAIAVPIDEYNIVDVEIARVADTMKHIKKRKQVG